MILLIVFCCACRSCPLNKACCRSKSKKEVVQLGSEYPYPPQAPAQWGPPPVSAGPPVSPGGTILYQRQAAVSAMSKSAPPFPATYKKPIRGEKDGQNA